MLRGRVLYLSQKGLCLYELRFWILAIVIAKPIWQKSCTHIIKSSQCYLLIQARNSFAISVNLSNLPRCQLSHLKDVCKVISMHLPYCACTINTIITNISNASKDSFPKSSLTLTTKFKDRCFLCFILKCDFISSWGWHSFQWNICNFIVIK